MLLAILYSAEEQVIAAAPACDHQPYGDRYWTEYCPTVIDLQSEMRTAYVEIGDAELVARLLQTTDPRFDRNDSRLRRIELTQALDTLTLVKLHPAKRAA